MNDKLKMITYYSDSHERLYKNCFKQTFDLFLNEEIKLETVKLQQKAIDINLRGTDWKLSTKDKFIYFYKFLTDNLDSEFIVSSDCDIVFLGKIKNQLIEELGDFDAAFQSGKSGFNTGFYICRNSPYIRNMFSSILKNWNINKADESNLNYYYKRINKERLKFKNLSKLFTSTYSTTTSIKEGSFFYNRLSKERQVFVLRGDGKLASYPPSGTLVFHACGIREVEKKEQALLIMMGKNKIKGY